MRNWLVAPAVAWLIISPALAQIVPSLPFQLQNNTLADANQVMANFNQIRNGVNANGAKNGANNDITALLGLTTPIPPSEGGTNIYTGGVSTGSANAQVVASVVPSVFTLAIGKRVVFVAGFTNTLAATLNVAATGAKAVHRKTTRGSRISAGYELHTGDIVEVVYDGTQYQLLGPVVNIGEVTDLPDGTAVGGYFMADGSCQSQTTYPGLFEVLGTNWGACAAGEFALPDYNGRVGIGKDNGANRVTLAGSGCAGNTYATGCGAQNQTILQANFPNVTMPNTLGISNTMGTTIGTLAISNTMGISDTRTWITSNALLPAGGVTGPPAGALEGAATAQQPVVVNSGSITLTGGTSLTGAPALTGGTSITGSVTSGGSGTALTTLQPSLVVQKLIKY